MTIFIIHFKSGSTLRVKGNKTAVASAADPENGATRLTNLQGRMVSVNPKEVEYVEEQRDV